MLDGNLIELMVKVGASLLRLPIIRSCSFLARGLNAAINDSCKTSI